uniref:DNA ligase D n=1 Tax=Pedobacter schmidteae TaxID=2201271 RepID=UPI000EABCDFE|nr:DNA ligase D [Pedobacter schmidteae]
MSLTEYRQKRSSDKTPEPFGGKPSGTALRFVIQKHDASHLHYDFRLEMSGVLKSWAIPKGPSTDPEVKRLAMMVEDHPLDYGNFEGIIPKGQYGGGTVIVWDQGTYKPTEPMETNVKKQEKNLLHQLHSGKLKFILKGKKLKGVFALVKAYGRNDNSWLLMKLEDKYASTNDITLKDKSVISKKTIAQMERTPDKVYGKTSQRSTSSDAVPISLKDLLKDARKQAFYEHLEPMLATLVDKPFDSDEWLYEIKWDGYRAIAFMNKDKLALQSRNNKSFNEKFYPIYKALQKLKLNAVLDGEIVVAEENGRGNFGDLQNWRSEADGELLYYVFDILWYNGQDLKSLPLEARKAILQQVLPTDDVITISKDFDTSGIEFLKAAKKMGLEGIMAKRKNSKYISKKRTGDWLKIKANKRQEVIIGGYTRNDDTKKQFSSLLVGVYEDKKLIYTGKVGTGFNDKVQIAMMRQFTPLVVDKSPFNQVPDVNKPSRFRPNPPHATVIWLKPQLICEVSFTEMTNDGVMRHPSFEGMRDDKPANQIVLEKETHTSAMLKHTENEIVRPGKKSERKTLLNPTETTQVKKINGHELKFTNLNKIFWPDEKISKRDLINYYYQVTPYILPYLKDRPQSMNRFPDGIKGEGFYYKDVTGKAPDWIKTYLYQSEADKRNRKYLVGDDEATLLYMANLACIEMNPWFSTIKKPDHPTFCIIDLDPDKNSFDQVIETAQVTRAILEDMDVPCYCKTSGSTGLHIYIPLGNKYTYEQSKEFARIIVTLVHRELPKYTTLERQISNRKGKMYLDFLQNRPHATIACAYSVRPKPGATVSMPLEWDEVKKGLKMKDFTIYNTIERLKTIGDIFKPVLGKGINLKTIITKAAKEKAD